MITYKIDHPHSFSGDDIAKFYNLLVENNQVSSSGLPDRIRNSYRLGVAYDGNHMVSIGSIKRIESGYISSIIEMSHSAYHPNLFKFELGYLFTLESYRGNGICKSIMIRLLDSFDSDYPNAFIYATTKTDNLAMLHLLNSLGFEISGDAYTGRLSGDEIYLLVRKPSFLINISDEDTRYIDWLGVELPLTVLASNAVFEFENPSYNTCELCGNCMVGRWNYTRVIGLDGNIHIICDNCASLIFSQDQISHINCESCGNSIILNDGINNYYTITGDDHNICNDCADRLDACESCGDLCYRTYTINGDEYCRDCFENIDSFSCESCGNRYYMDDCYMTDSDEMLCHDCYQENMNRYDDYDGDRIGSSGNHILGYHPGISPKFFNHGNKDSKLYMGIELEIECPSSTNYIADIFTSKFKALGGQTDNFYLTNDASLNNGFEIVCHPMTFNYHTKVFKWSELLSILRDMKCTSHDSGSCGLHIHLNRDFFSSTDLIKIGLFVYTQKILMSTMCRRGYNSYCKGKTIDDPRDITNTHDRYEAVNYTNARTIEIRQGRGTLNELSFYAYIEFIDCMVNFIKVNSLNLIGDESLCLTKFFEYAMNRKKRYSKMLEYLNNHGFVFSKTDNDEIS